MIIDAHCHVWPDHIAPLVLANRPAGLAARSDGTIDGLTRSMDVSGIDRAMTLAIANKPKNVQSTNAFIGGVDRSRFVPFGTVHPGLSIEENLTSLRDNGIRGVKLHPLFQALSLADPAVGDLLRALAESSVVVITHAGAGGDDDANQRAAPMHLRAIVDSIPELVLIACHYGGYHRIDEAEEFVVGAPVVLETSWPPRLAEFDQNRLRDIIVRHGADRIVFGSDWPMTDHGAELAAIRSLGLAANDEQSILGGNLQRILSI
jgi:predicted TIM-barrel fold metal-dependent hydrolase